MSKRLQVLLEEDELREIQRAARRSKTTVAEWVRQALRAARRREPTGNRLRKLQAIREAARHRFPAPPIEQMLEEIERGYLDDGPK
jgi:nitroreductase